MEKKWKLFTFKGEEKKMNCIVHILAVVTTFCLLDDVFSHSTGADTRACNLAEMKPQHTGVNEYITNNNTYQFKLTLGANVYDPTDPTKTSKWIVDF